MINEQLEVQEYIDGKNINKRCIYRICYLLAKYYHGLEYDHLQIRDSIFNWAKQNNIYIEFNLNNLINAAISDKTELRGDVPVHVSNEDIDEIRRRFDTKNTRLLALALLCYGKACAVRGECSISLLAMANWLNLDYANMRNRHFKELVDFGYITKMDTRRKWKKSKRNQMTRIKFNVSLKNNDGTKLIDNNVVSIFYKYF